MWKKMYLHLFNQVTDAIEMLTQGENEKASKILIWAQQNCEELYINWPQMKENISQKTEIDS